MVGSQCDNGSARLKGKVATVTGAGSGIGRAVALLFAQEGAKVVCADISGQEKEVAESIGENAIAVHADITKADRMAGVIDTAVQKFGRLDVQFNNARFSGEPAPLAEFDEPTYDLILTVNLKSVFLGMKYGIAAMLATGGGSVINIASAAGLVGWKGKAIYAAAKGGVVQLTKSAALDYAIKGIRVNAICAGMTWAGLEDASPDGSSPEPDTTPPQPAKHGGLPQELTTAALFLASEDSSFVTGTAIPVNGGYLAR